MHNKQLVSAYAVFMIVGSEFKKCRFANPMIEGRLRAEYVEVKSNEQFRLEELAIDMLQDLEIDPVECTVRYYNSGNNLILDFITGKNNVRAIIDTQGYFEIKNIRVKSKTAALV